VVVWNALFVGGYRGVEVAAALSGRGLLALLTGPARPWALQVCSMNRLIGEQARRRATQDCGNDFGGTVPTFRSVSHAGVPEGLAEHSHRSGFIRRHLRYVGTVSLIRLIHKRSLSFLINQGGGCTSKIMGKPLCSLAG
jgi:hypothetical protein